MLRAKGKVTLLYRDQGCQGTENTGNSDVH